jgi:imidazolonepropionase-like amidohydrolase
VWLTGGRVYDVHEGRFAAGDLRVEDGRIAEIGKAPGGADAVDLDGAYLLPGFIDCHVHICVDTESPDPNNPWRDALPGSVALWAARAARRILMCGITSARDVGGWDYHEIALREAIAAGWLEGTRLFCAGRILTMTCSTTPYFIGMYEEADGPDEVRKAARKQLAKGADLIKIMASGAVTSTKYERADAIQYRPDEIRAAVEIAADNYTHVAAHAHAGEAIRNAAECGCRSVEHGTFGDEEIYRLMAEKGTYLVPTVCTGPAMMRDPSFAARVPPHIHERYAATHKIRTHNIRLAHEVGVRIAMGTDVGTPGNHAGDNMQEVVLMVEACGLSPAEAIRASTLNGADLLGRAADLGSLEAGKIADVIAVPADPLADIATLNDVFFVMQEGRVHRNDRA